MTPGPVESRWLEWGPIVVAAAIGATLVGSQVLSVLDVRDAARSLAHGQAQTLLSTVRSELGSDPLASDALASSLERHRDEGLLYVAVLGPRRASAGESLAGAAPPPQPGRVEKVGDRLRIAEPLGRWRGAPGRRRRPPHPPFGRRPGPLGPPPGEMLGGGPPAPPAMLVLEVRPSLGAQLESTAQRTLVVGAAAALLGLLLAMALRRLLRQRAELERSAEQDRRLAALGQMSAVLAHELRNPLASLKGHAQLLQETLPEGKAADKAERVVREAVRLEELTDNLLDFVRTGQPRRRDVDPKDVVRRAAAAVGEARFQLDLEGAPERWSLDPDALGRALENVMRNAAQISGEPIDVRLHVRDGELTFVVRDRGPGIAEDELGRVFEAFHTNATRGTGLGLAVAQRVVEGHGGRIEANNHADGGAVFELRIPPGERLS